MERNVLVRGLGRNVPKNTPSLEVSVSFCSPHMTGILFALEEKRSKKLNSVARTVKKQICHILKDTEGYRWQGTHSNNLLMLKNMGQQPSETLKTNLFQPARDLMT